MNEQLRRRSVGTPAARSTLLTILGEYLRPLGTAVWQETLIAALGSLGHKPQAARQAIARSVADGWISTERQGRRSRVRLTSGGIDLLNSGAERIYGFGEVWQWDGRWLLVAVRVPEDRREVRHRLRTRLAWEGFGTLGGGLWISPHVERETALSEIADSSDDAVLFTFRAEGSLGDSKSVISAAWDLATVETGYQAFITRFGKRDPHIPDSIFRAQTELVHEWRRFPFLDPNLPESLLPRNWPRSRAHKIFLACHERWRAPAQDYFRTLEEGASARRSRSDDTTSPKS